jgi:DNA modification methylase
MSVQLALRDLESEGRGALPIYESVFLGSELPEKVFDALRKLDWSFTNDETQFLTHDLHPYPAKFIPQIPGHIISYLSRPGELVLDPFGGSGTTALEAVRLGRRAISIDANPVAVLIGRVKTARLDKVKLAEINGFHARLTAELNAGLEDPAQLLKDFSTFIPDIPNREKWFPDTSCSELALIRARIAQLENREASDLALLALSRVVLKVSFQDSETRYKSTHRDIAQKQTLIEFLKELEDIRAAVDRTASYVRYGDTRFIKADVRSINEDELANDVADLVVTSPPYGNAYDYHLYHRFRLLWLGFDPKELGAVEIGSHLKHQREGSGFESYLADIGAALKTIHRALKPGRYAALVVGTSIYDGVTYDSAKKIETIARSTGFDASSVVIREIHQTKRSFEPVARRARNESILFIRKAPEKMTVSLSPPPYHLWPYEAELRRREVGVLTGMIPNHRWDPQRKITCAIDSLDFDKCRRLVFSHIIGTKQGLQEKTWQALLENGTTSIPSARKDPKYVTHGLHPYKGKFYPQLAKGLMNLINPPSGSVVFDPFCGCGTTLLEGYLNGLRGFGADMNPLAALIARAKVNILEVSPEIVKEACDAMFVLLEEAPADPKGKWTQFSTDCEEEIRRWFAVPVAGKLDWTLRQIRRVSAGAVRDFLEAILSSIVRDVSQQDPADLRIRYRKQLLNDADVYGMFRSALHTQLERVEKFWRVRGCSPYLFQQATVQLGDSREWSTFEAMQLRPETVDLILTSPPYATALPYIDTDRLSMLTVMGMHSSVRRPIEYNLIGSREITAGDRRKFEEEVLRSSSLPEEISAFVLGLSKKLANDDAGFRKLNMPALLLRFFSDMEKVLGNAYRVAKSGAHAMVVIGDNTIRIKGKEILIPTTDFVGLVAQSVGFRESERIDISVTTENMVHIKNAITQNIVLCLKKT